MAVAQIWQWKMEQLQMKREPLVIFGADFSDKEKGTVFERKVLMTQLMLGVRDLCILTPDPKYYEEQKTGRREHPSAPYWEGQRDANVNRVCQMISEFKGKTIHFYVMAPGRGCVDTVVRGL